MHILKSFVLAAAISSLGMASFAGNPGAPTMESEVAAPEETFEVPQGSVNGGYLVIGALALMALLASNI